MALKRKKGHFLVSKTLVSKLKPRNLKWLLETKKLFNQVVEFFVLVYQTHPELADVPSNDVYIAIEPLTIANKNRPTVLYPLPHKCPQVFRRAAIKKALGIFKSWHTQYTKWKVKCQKIKEKEVKKGRKYKLPRPPLLPRQYNCSPTFYKGMYKEDTKDELVIKLWTGKSWVEVKHHYQGFNLPSEWVKASPSLVIKEDKITLNWTFEKLGQSLGKIIKQVENNGKLRVWAVDLNIDGDIAVASILESANNSFRSVVRELDRKFVKGYNRHQRRASSRASSRDGSVF